MRQNWVNFDQNGSPATVSVGGKTCSPQGKPGGAFNWRTLLTWVYQFIFSLDQ
jgi:hypothetical protein